MTDNLSIIWGRRIKQMRADRGLSQRAVAALAEIDKGYFARIETGQLGGRGVGDDIRIRLARALGCQVADLFPYPDTSPENACLSAADAPDAAPSRTPATKAARRSPAPNATAQDASAHAGSHGSERRPA